MTIRGQGMERWSSHTVVIPDRAADGGTEPEPTKRRVGGGGGSINWRLDLSGDPYH
jgi:hypothetical protein